MLFRSALVVISTLYAGNGPLGTEAGLAANGITGALTKANLMQSAVGTALGSEVAGNIIIAVCLTFFAFTTIISWNFFGRQNIQYLVGKKSSNVAVIVYSVVAIAFIFLGSVLQNDLVWELTDMFNNLMVIPNVLALAFLSKFVVDEASSAYARKKEAKAEKKALKK